MHLTDTGESAEDVRTYLRLSSLLDAIQRHHPEVSAPLRLDLFRARRDRRIDALDEGDFRAAAAGVGLEGTAARHALS